MVRTTVHSLIIGFTISAFWMTGISRPATAGSWRIPAGAPLLTAWAKSVDPNGPLPEYPRPQLVRQAWLSLNGLWQFTGAHGGDTPPFGKDLDSTVLVPYPVESALSGVMRSYERMWYRQVVAIPGRWKRQRVLLHFGAVDWEATVYVNGKLAGTHRGGYDPFTFDITDLLHKHDLQEIVVGVYDPSDGGEQPRGKQTKIPRGIWYTPVSGIWQSVWMEPVPPTYIAGLVVSPDVDANSVHVKVLPSGTSGDELVTVSLFDGKRKTAESSGKPGETVTIPIASPKLWSPSTPFLYDMSIVISRSGKTLDAVKSYVGMRKIEVARDERGIERIMLNGKFLMQIGTLDQGFWPDGIYTAPTDRALRNDIEMLKALGFNMTRKHVKVEPDRWYYWTDKLGLLVWQDMPSGKNGSPESRQEFESELTRMVETHRNHPSIIMWVVFNEGWGQYDTERLSAVVKALDPTRLVNGASGWTDTGAGDVLDIHNYPRPVAPKPESRRAIVLGEFGGLGLAIPGHTWKKEHWGYKGMADNRQLSADYQRFLHTVYALKDDPGLSAAVYTQTTDVEVECNGLLTYDRAIVKPDVKIIAAANKGDFSTMLPLPTVRPAVESSQHEPQRWQYTTERPGDGWASAGFDDGAWKRGYGGFGKTESPGLPVRTTWDTTDIWLRRSFELPTLPRGRFALTILHDDEAEVYLNGVPATKEDGWTSEYEISDIDSAARAALKVGRNVLAVHCHQHSGGQYIDVGIVELIPAPPAEVQVPGGVRIRNEEKLIPSQRGVLYPGNRSPLVPSPFMKLPIGSITPSGWLREMLLLEKSGMTGRLEEISPWLDWKTSAWASKEGAGARGWEELPYWLKGYGDLGYVLHDRVIINEARKWVEAVLSAQREDGWFGPRELLTSLKGKPDLWPNMVMLNVMQSYYEYSGDERILWFMRKYFRWQDRLPVEDFGAGYWPKIRMGDNIESIYWLYNRTGDEFLLPLAEKLFHGMARWDDDVINWHNVNIAQGFRAPAVYYQGARDITLLNAAERNYEKVMGEYGQFPGGGFAADENARPGFTDPRQGFETCGIVEFMHSFEMLTRISGDPAWSDRCEYIAFNSLPAAMTPDLKGLHYLTCANQVQLDKGTKAPSVQNGGTMFSYSPFEVYRCCQHNVSHGWPYFAEELWLATSDSGLCASLYAPSAVTANVGHGSEVTLTEEPDYPFDGVVRLKISTNTPVSFPLYLRVPAWSEDPSLKLNGKLIEGVSGPSAYIIVERSWVNGDALELHLPMRLKIHTWEKNGNSVSVNYGPLTFALEIGEKWSRYGANKEWPEWEVFPTTPWNYGLSFDPDSPAGSFTVSKRVSPPGVNPFTAESVPVTIDAKGRRVPGWQQDYLGVVGTLQQSPARTMEPEESIRLVPMGAARLRIASFPTVTSGNDGHDWVPPPKPKAIDFAISTSFMNQYDSKEAVADGFEPKSSNDEAVSRMTWWPHKGTTEWIEYDFPEPRKVSGVSVYWVDTGDEGGFRVPQSWRLLYRDGDSWVEVEHATAYGTARDTYNTVSFAPVKTAGLRLELELRPDVSAGILEWKLGEK